MDKSDTFQGMSIEELLGEDQRDLAFRLYGGRVFGVERKLEDESEKMRQKWLKTIQTPTPTTMAIN
jgi:hypothetical protein